MDLGLEIGSNTGVQNFMSHFSTTTRARLTSVVALLLVALSYWVSNVLGGYTLGLSVFSVHLGLALGLTIRFGPAFAVASGLGCAVVSLMSGAGIVASLASFAGISLGALGAASLLARLKLSFKSEAAKRCLLMGLACLVFAPIAAVPVALLGLLASGSTDAQFVPFVTQWIFTAFSAVLFAPLVLTWWPERKSPSSLKSLGNTFSRSVIALIALCLLSAHYLGGEKVFVMGQVLLILALALSLVPAFIGSERASSMTIAVLATVFVIEQAIYAQGGASVIQLDPYQRVGLACTFMFVGAVLGHLLNGLSIQNVLTQNALQEQVMRNPFSGLPNRRFFFKALHELTENPQRHAEFLGEIAIPDLAHWAEFSGREAAHQFDARIVERIDFSLKDSAHFVAHVGLGSYFLHLKLTADPLAVIEAIEAAVHEACTMHGIKGMKLRPQVALLRVPRDVRATPEDILATLSHSLQRSSHSLKRWSMTSLQSGLLQKQRDESRENEIIVESLSSSLVRVFTQTIQPVQGQVGEGLHFEVLARLQNLQGGYVSPARFLPVYATCGLLPQFDRQVIQTLFEAFELEPSLVNKIAACSINLTGPTLSDPDLIAFIEAQFAGALIKPSQIVFEITESDRISNPMQALENVEELRRLGASIALDDFGTGLASFEYLKLFKPDWIKIDGSFVRDALLNPLGAEVISSMIRVARAAGSKVVAEQVEDQPTVDFMTQLGAHYVQGYAVSKPRPLDDLVAALREQSDDKASKPMDEPLAGPLSPRSNYSKDPPRPVSNVKNLPWVKETFGV